MNPFQGSFISFQLRYMHHSENTLRFPQSALYTWGKSFVKKICMIYFLFIQIRRFKPYFIWNFRKVR